MEQANDGNMRGVCATDILSVDVSSADYTAPGNEVFFIRVSAAGTARIIPAKAGAVEKTITFTDSDVGVIFPLAIRTIKNHADSLTLNPFDILI